MNVEPFVSLLLCVQSRRSLASFPTYVEGKIVCHFLIVTIFRSSAATRFEDEKALKCSSPLY